MVSPADIAREYVENWNRRDWKAYRELLDDQYTYTGGDGQTQRGPEAGMAVGQMFATAFPDGRIDLRQIHTAGDTAVVEFTGHGTHSGELMGIAPTGRRISIPVITVLTESDADAPRTCSATTMINSASAAFNAAALAFRQPNPDLSLI